MKTNVDKLLDNAFNPLHEYKGSKIYIAVRNALQIEGTKEIQNNK